jgi:hypothetical protein
MARQPVKRKLKVPLKDANGLEEKKEGNESELKKTKDHGAAYTDKGVGQHREGLVSDDEDADGAREDAKLDTITKVSFLPRSHFVKI